MIDSPAPTGPCSGSPADLWRLFPSSTVPAVAPTNIFEHDIQNPVPRIRLESDFHDVYDHWFSSTVAEKPCSVPLVIRNTQDGLRKRDQFDILQHLGYLVPQHGSVQELAAHRPVDQLLVVYLDELAHSGHGKVLLRVDAALEHTPYAYASVFIAQPSMPAHALSYRILVIGDAVWCLLYRSARTWTSNRGKQVESRVVGRPRRLGPRDRRWSQPIYAVDMVRDAQNRYWAIDLNSGPQLHSTAMDTAPPRVIFDLIAAYVLKDFTPRQHALLCG